MLPALRGTTELVAVAERRRAAMIATCCEFEPPKEGRLARLLAAVKVRMEELVLARNEADYWAGQEWVHELYRLTYTYLYDREPGALWEEAE